MGPALPWPVLASSFQIMTVLEYYKGSKNESLNYLKVWKPSLHHKLQRATPENRHSAMKGWEGRVLTPEDFQRGSKAITAINY